MEIFIVKDLLTCISTLIIHSNVRIIICFLVFLILRLHYLCEGIVVINVGMNDVFRLVVNSIFCGFLEVREILNNNNSNMQAC